MSNKNYIYGDLYAAQSGGTIFSAGTALELIFGAGGGETLAQTLALGNTTGANDIILTDGQDITSSVGGGQLTLNDSFGPDGTWSITSDNRAYGSGSTWVYGQVGNGGQLSYQKDASEAIGFGVYSSGVTEPLMATAKEVVIIDNTSGNKSSGNIDKRAVFVGTRNSTINAGVTNSVVVGGVGITASQDDTLYTQNARLAENSGVIYSAGTDLYSIFATSDKNVANDNLTLDATRTHDLNGNDLSFSGTGNIGIGTSSPLARLTVVGTNAPTSSILNDRYSSGTGGPTNTLRHARGTEALPTASLSQDQLGALKFGGYGDTMFVNSSSQIIAFAEGTFTDSSTPASLRFSTTPSGSIVDVERLRIDPDGNVGIGITPTVKLHVNGNVVVGDISGNTVHAQDFFSMAPYTDGSPASPSDNDTWFHSGATGTITINYRTGGNNFSVELAP
jgi:hypothetical protein